jgi:hypothetical protein
VNITNLTVQQPYTNNGAFLVRWQTANGNFHCWTDGAGTVGRATGRRYPTLYKRGPDDPPTKQPRYLDASNNANAAMIAEVLRQARDGDLFAKARQSTAEVEAAEAAKRAELGRIAKIKGAAPDLLEALQWIADHGDTTEGGRPACHAMRAKAREAIAKALGNS